jgi:hypothetical protein
MSSRHIMALWVSGPNPRRRPEIRKYDAYPGRDDNVDSPTGYFVIKISSEYRMWHTNTKLYYKRGTV